MSVGAPLQNQVEAFITAWTQGGSGVAYTPQGLAVAGTQGVLRNAANAALLALVHARHSSGYGAVRLACWARDQVCKASHQTCLAPSAAVAPNSRQSRIPALHRPGCSTSAGRMFHWCSHTACGFALVDVCMHVCWSSE